MRKSPLWQEFISHIEHGPNLIDSDCFRDLKSDPGARYLGRELSDLNFGSEVVPHKDKYSKIASFIFYFNEHDEANADGVGATQFYTPKKKFHNNNFFNQSLSFDEVDTLLQAESVPNRLVVFQRSARSWHGVQPIKVQDFSRPVYIMAVMRKQTLKDSTMEFLIDFCRCVTGLFVELIYQCVKNIIQNFLEMAREIS